MRLVAGDAAFGGVAKIGAARMVEVEVAELQGIDPHLVTTDCDAQSAPPTDITAQATARFLTDFVFRIAQFSGSPDAE